MKLDADELRRLDALVAAVERDRAPRPVQSLAELIALRRRALHGNG